MSTNLYTDGHPLMIDSGTFWRCRHGHTAFVPCWKCGVFYPLRFIGDWLDWAKSRWT